MKKRIFLLVACIFIFFGCSEEESIEALELENTTTISNELQNSATTGFAAAFICDPDWTPPIYTPSFGPQSTIPKLIHITYTDEVALEDIDCIRQEYFLNYQCLRMHILQPNNPRHDVWIDLAGTPICSLPTGSTTTGQTQPLATSPNDTRVCKAPPEDCD